MAVVEQHYQVRCTSIEGTKDWTLSYGKGAKKLTIIARWQADKREYNAGPLNEPFVGLLRQVKEMWGKWAAENYGKSTESQAPALENVIVPTQAKTRGKVSKNGGLRPEPTDLSPEQLAQHRIHSAETTEDAVKRWVAAYNEETVSLSMGKVTRHVYELPQTGKLVPTLAECYDKTRDQYTWPNKVKGDVCEQE